MFCFWLEGVHAERTLVKNIPVHDKYISGDTVKRPDGSVVFNEGDKGSYQIGTNNWKLKTHTFEFKIQHR